MKLDRRTMMAATAGAAIACPGLAQGKKAARGWYDQAIIIDALGGVGDPSEAADRVAAAEDALRALTREGEP